MKLAYVDSSVALKIGFAEPLTMKARQTVAQLVDQGYQLVSSELLAVEVHRVWFRDRGTSAGADELVGNFALVRLGKEVLDLASSIPHIIKTLDAIHVATALYLDEDDLVLVTHDDNMLTIAKAMGLQVEGL